MEKIYNELKNAIDKGEDLDIFKEIRGFLAPEEGYSLMLMSALGEGEGEVVEIGSFLGKSTCYLAMGLKARKKGCVYAVDHFQGSPEHQVGKKHEEPSLVKEGTLLYQFYRNLQFYGLQDYVKPLVSESTKPAHNWQKPIRLLFIDGDHSYDATRRDFENWAIHVPDYGYIVFHDVGPSWPGVTKFFNQIINSNSYKLRLSVGSVRVVQAK